MTSLARASAADAPGQENHQGGLPVSCRGPGLSRCRGPSVELPADGVGAAARVGAGHEDAVGPGDHAADRAGAPVPLRPLGDACVRGRPAPRASRGLMRASASSCPGACACGQKESGKLRVATRGASTACCGAMPWAVMFRKTWSIACCWTSPPGRAERHERAAVAERHGRRGREPRPLAAARRRSRARRRASPVSRAARRRSPRPARPGSRRSDRSASRRSRCPRRPRPRRSRCRASRRAARDRPETPWPPLATARSEYGSPAGGMSGQRAVLPISARRASAYSFDRSPSAGTFT